MENNEQTFQDKVKELSVEDLMKLLQKKVEFYQDGKERIAKYVAIANELRNEIEFMKRLLEEKIVQ